MKKYIYKIFALLIVFSITQSCETDEKTIDEVFAGLQRGGVLRTIEIQNGTFDFFNTSSEWIITVEAQDVENGDLLAEVRIYSAFVNDGVAGTENLVKAVPASAFSQGPIGLPRADIAVSLQEVLNAGGLVAGDYDSSDSFNVRFEYVMTDGRTYSNTNTSSTVTGGSFFSSPFKYSVQFFCALTDASMFDGNYVVVIDAWADYGEGDIVPVEFISDYTFRILSTNNLWINNTTTSYMEVTINPEDGSVVVSSNECFDTNWGGGCLDVTGYGSVGTCTGDINLVIDVGAYTDNTFSLVKQ
ncbi:MAG: hypothetical protein JXR31_14750 [Prolixibacteraceae bacterium]|nr:hypothetical protein [Prolixibacteraceae bacterium]